MQSINHQTINQLASAIQAAVMDHQTLSEVHNISMEEMAALYQKTYEAFQKHDFASALGGFSSLTLCDPWRKDHLIGLASCYHALGEFKSALVFYGYALLLDEANAAIAFRLAQCYVSLNEKALAVETLHTCIDLSHLSPKQPDICRLAKTLLHELDCTQFDN